MSKKRSKNVEPPPPPPRLWTFKRIFLWLLLLLPFLAIWALAVYLRSGGELPRILPATPTAAPPPAQAEPVPQETDPIERLTLAVNNNPGDIERRNLLVENLLAAGRAEEALPFIEFAVAQGSVDERSLLNFGRVLTAVGRNEEALKLLDQALVRSPDQFNLVMTRADALRRLDRMDEAADAYMHASRLDPDNKSARQFVAYTLANSNDRTNALRHYRALIKDNPYDVEQRSNLGVLLTQLDEFDEAINELQQAVAMDPSYTNALYALGYAYQQKGDNVSAIQQYDLLLDIAPNHAPAQRRKQRLENLIQSDEEETEAPVEDMPEGDEGSPEADETQETEDAAETE